MFIFFRFLNPNPPPPNSCVDALDMYALTLARVGELLYFPAMAWHSTLNIGRGTCKVLCVCVQNTRVCVCVCVCLFRGAGGIAGVSYATGQSNSNGILFYGYHIQVSLCPPSSIMIVRRRPRQRQASWNTKIFSYYISLSLINYVCFMINRVLSFCFSYIDDSYD